MGVLDIIVRLLDQFEIIALPVGITICICFVNTHTVQVPYDSTP
jgi:hypothetical protein